MARKREGRLRWTDRNGYVAQLTINVPGKPRPVRRNFLLAPEGEQLTDRALATRRMKALAESLDKAPIKLPPIGNVDAFALDWIQARIDRGIPAAKNELRLYKRVWSPAIGKLNLKDVGTGQIHSVLEDVSYGRVCRLDGQPYSRESLTHIRATIYRVLNAAWKAELVPENKAAKVDLPDTEDVRKPRVVPTDLEISALVSSPKVDLEIKVLVVMSRTVAGLRTGDLNRATWEGFGPGFETYTFVRRKTRKKRPYPETHAVPLAARPVLVAWHEHAGFPEYGPVFPVRRGKRAGLPKKQSKQTYAARLRRAFRQAGVTRHELHHETETTLPVDFHSCRRAYSTALARANVNEQTAMDLTGHADSKTHRRYLDATRVKELPPSAVPLLGPFALPKNDESRSGRRDSNPRRPPWQGETETEASSAPGGTRVFGFRKVSESTGKPKGQGPFRSWRPPLLTARPGTTIKIVTQGAG